MSIQPDQQASLLALQQTMMGLQQQLENEQGKTNQALKELVEKMKKQINVLEQQNLQQQAQINQLQAQNRQHQQLQKQTQSIPQNCPINHSSSRYVTLRPIALYAMQLNINQNNTVKEARIAAAAHLKCKVQYVFLAYQVGYNPTGASDSSKLKDMGLPYYSYVYFYHSIPLEATTISNPVPGLFVPKVFHRKDLGIPYDSVYVGPFVDLNIYKYTDFLYCQHPNCNKEDNLMHYRTMLSTNWLGRHSHGDFDILIRVKTVWDEGYYKTVGIEKKDIGGVISACGKYGPSVYITKRIP